ncbi:MAPEG family protein [Romeria aff. gracilis LEGE 07310]|uniref:MAPEG family protein n=1 Tax=Vasconcelosia minhoensis LEGE 07310 TaxID=915328 RepID=A0A8J7AE38_9CYAN|nr:MAPEG family protein [Romeria gracilis]MBE9077804.1 MAPEG family protein [Romeria aff. gracilis LEGE 07310]
MTVPVVSATVAAVLIILQQSLMIAAGMHRTKVGISAGVGNDANLERKVRRHGNLAENAALFVATLALAELCDIPKPVVAGFGSIFILSRMLHVFGFSSLAGSHLAEGSKAFLVMRAIGAGGTFLTGIVLGVFLVFSLARAL